MKKSKLLKFFLLFLIVSTVLFSFQVKADNRVTCAVNSTDNNCLPPTLGNLQTTLVSLIGTMYSMVGFIFLGILVFNGIIYLIGYLEDAKYILGASIEDVQKRMTQWLIGFMMVLISYPLVNGFMKLIVSDNSCYTKLNNPMVQFIFPQVCSPNSATDVNNETVTDTPTLNPTIEQPVPQNTVACTNYSAAFSNMSGDDYCLFVVCKNNSSEKYQSDSFLYNTIWCDCLSNKCWSVIDN